MPEGSFPEHRPKPVDAQEASQRESAKKEEAEARERKEFEERVKEFLAQDLEMLGRRQTSSGYLNLLKVDGEESMVSRKRARWFMDCIISEIRSIQDTDPSSTASLAAVYYDTLFSSHPSAFDYLPVKDQLDVLVRASRIPVLQGELVPAWVGNFVYDLSFSRDPVSVLGRQYAALSLTDRLDMLDFLPTIFRNARGQSDWAAPAAEGVKGFLDSQQKQAENSLLFSFVISNTLERVQAEEDRPTGGVERVLGDRASGRMRDSITDAVLKDDAALRQKISVLGTDGLLRRISTEAVVLLGHAMIPQRFMRLTKEEEGALPESAIDQSLLTKIRRGLQRPGVYRQHQFLWYSLTNLQNRVLRPEERSPESWAERLPVFSAEEWRDYWDLEANDPKLRRKLDRYKRRRIRLRSERIQLQQIEFDLATNQRRWQAYVDRLYRDPRLVPVLREIVADIPGPPPREFEPFENFEGNRLIMPKGGKEGIEASVLLQVMHRPAIREQLDERLGFSVTELSLREQIQLLSFLINTTEKEGERVFGVIRRFGLAAARAFLSCEYGRKYGESIVKIGEELPDIAALIFERYGRIADLAFQSAESLLEQFYVVQDNRKIDVEKVAEEFLSRAKNLIGRIGDKLDRGEFNSKKLLKELDLFEAQAILLAGLFKTEVKVGRKEVPFEHIKGITFQVDITPDALSDADREEMCSIFDLNWSDQDPNAAALFRKALEHAIAPGKKGTRFSVLRNGAEIVAYIRFDESPDVDPNTLYAGSLNVNPKYRGSGIGEVMMYRTLDEKGKDHVLDAHVAPAAVVGTNYTELLNLLIVGISRKRDENNSPESEAVLLHIMRDDRRTGMYRARQPGVTWERLRKGEIPGVEVKTFDLRTEMDHFISTIQALPDHGQIVTRYKADPKEPMIRMIAIEPQITDADLSRSARSPKVGRLGSKGPRTAVVGERPQMGLQ